MRKSLMINSLFFTIAFCCLISTRMEGQWTNIANGKLPQNPLTVSNYIIARARINDSTVSIGVTLRGLIAALIMHDNQIIGVSNYEVYTGANKWITYNGSIPPNAVQGGHQANGQPIYIAKALYNGVALIGQVYSNGTPLFMINADKTIKIKNFEVLIKDDNTKNDYSQPTSSNTVRLWEFTNGPNMQYVKKFYKDGNKIVAITDDNMLCISDDNGISWQKRYSEALIELLCYANVSDIVATKNLICLAVSGKILTSFDNGISWQERNTGTGTGRFYKFQNILYYNTRSSANKTSITMISNDLGSNWQEISTKWYSSIVFNNETIALTTESQEDDLISTNKGMSWVSILNKADLKRFDRGDIVGLVDKDIVIKRKENKFFISKNKGKTYIEFGSFLPIQSGKFGANNSQLFNWDLKTIYTYTTVNLTATWTKLEVNWSGDILDLYFKDNLVYLITTEGGYYSNTNGKTWFNINISNDLTNSLYLMSLYVNNNKLFTRRHMQGKDYFFTLVHGTNRWIAKEEEPILDLNKNSDTWKNWANLGKLYYMCNLDEKGSGYTGLKTTINIGNKIFESEYNKGMTIRVNTMTSTAEINNGLWDKKILAIAALGTNVFVGTKEAGVFFTSDFGNNWVYKSNGLEGKKVNTLLSHNNTLYAGTDNGVFYTKDNGNTWIRSKSILKGKVFSLVICQTHIYAGTSTGVWKIPASLIEND